MKGSGLTGFDNGSHIIMNDVYRARIKFSGLSIWKIELPVTILKTAIGENDSG